MPVRHIEIINLNGDKIMEITLSEEQQETAQRLCDEGVGRTSEENKTIKELLQGRIDNYLRQTANMHLSQDRRKLTKEEIKEVLLARETLKE